MQAVANQASIYQDAHTKRVMGELEDVGVSSLGFSRFDMHYLPSIIQPTEHVMGVVYGISEGNSVLLAATDRRIIFLNKKPLFADQDDIRYEAVSGIRVSHAVFGSTITLHTKVKDYSIRTFNRKSAGRFVHFIEFHCMRLVLDKKGKI